MTPLAPDAVDFVFVHTAAYDGEASVADVRRWHVCERGWSDIGYHLYIRRSGEVETGRSTRYIGAHVLGANFRSIGICCEGHGDHEPFTFRQLAALVPLVVDILTEHDLPPEACLGHREINELVEAGEAEEWARTRKSCPGTEVDMDALRELVRLWQADPDTALAV